MSDSSSSSAAFNCLALLVGLALPVLLIFLIVKAKKKPTVVDPIQQKLSLVSTTTTSSPAAGQGGIFFGVTKRGEPLGKPIGEDGHVLVVGGAGSGKSTCIAIPTLRDTWHAPALVVDIKGELLKKSQRASAHVFNPCDVSRQGYDPFYLLRETNDDPRPDIREIALTLCPMPAEVKDPFWIQNSQNILTGHLLFSYKQGATFAQAMRILQSTPPEVLLEVDGSDEDARMYFMQCIGLKSETLSGIMAELANKVMPFATDPQLQAALSKKDIITPALLEQGEDIFLQVPEYKLEQWKALFSLIVQQFLRHFERRSEDTTTPILFLLDEFARLGRMEPVISGLATLRSKRITIVPMIQSLSQLDAIYGHDNRKIIADNCSYKAILNATDADTQKYFSLLVGTEEREKITINKKQHSLLEDTMKLASEGSRARFDTGSSISATTEEKPIIKPEDFAYLKDNIVLLSPHGFTMVQKVPCYLSTSPVAGTTPTSSPAAGTVTRDPVTMQIVRQ